MAESVVIFGIGGVGLNVAQFAHLAGAYPIVAVDLLRGYNPRGRAGHDLLYNRTLGALLHRDWQVV